MEKALETMPSGIVSIWTHKAILPEIVSIMHGLGMVMPLPPECQPTPRCSNAWNSSHLIDHDIGCRYVENLVWYKIALNNANLDRASPYFRNSKEILLMFKKVVFTRTSECMPFLTGLSLLPKY
jgi:hypothetical protein